jgi:hypothetical protein
MTREIDALVMRALEKSPHARWPTAEEFVAAIDAIPSAKPTPKSGVVAKPAASATRAAEEPTARRSSGRKKRASGRNKTTSGTRPAKRTDTPLEVKFCERCSGSIPDEWKKTHAAKRLGTKLLCRGCYQLVHDGKCCMGCFRSLDLERGTAAGGNKRLCQACAAKADIMRVCSGCQMLLPRVAFERGVAFKHGGKFFCRECISKLRRKRD